jgi:TrmH family RNA methyltransferase
MPVKQFVDFLSGWPGESVATVLNAKASYRRNYDTPTLLVLGSEARGLSHDVSSACSTRVSIPMREGVESLNVATAAALLLYQASNP